MRSRLNWLFLSDLRSVWALRRTGWLAWRSLRGSLPEVERNEFVLVGAAKNRAGKVAPQHNASSAEGYSSSQRDGADNNAEKNNVDQQVGDIIFLVEVGVLVPGDAGVIIH